MNDRDAAQLFCGVTNFPILYYHTTNHNLHKDVHKDVARTAGERGVLMLEILFSESAAGSMKIAKMQDGLGGSPADIFCFPLCLDIGAINDDVLGEQRRTVLRDLFSIYPFGEATASEMISVAKDELARFQKRAPQNEQIRVWYSPEPDELCGWLWFASVLQETPAHGPVSVVLMPAWEENPDGTIVQRTGFAEVSPENWVGFLQFERTAPPLLIAGRQFDWTVLQQQNAGLRAVISGRVMSVPDSFYDFLIDEAICGLNGNFHEAVVIGNVLGRSQIGISDAWVAKRIQVMVDEGRLEVVENSDDPEAPVYHRVLRKAAC